MKKIHIKRKKTIEERLSDEVNKEVKEVKREWRHLVKFRDENYLLFTAFVILIMSLVIINTAYIIRYNRDRNHVPPKIKTVVIADPAKILTSEQTGSNDSLTIKISNVTETDKTDNAFTLDPSETMLIMDVSITNSSASTQQLIPVSQFYVRSNEGDHSSLHASSFVNAPLESTDLAPNQTVKGQLSFNVPKHVAHPMLYVDTGWGKNVPLVYDVLR